MVLALVGHVRKRLLCEVSKRGSRTNRPVGASALPLECRGGFDLEGRRVKGPGACWRAEAWTSRVVGAVDPEARLREEDPEELPLAEDRPRAGVFSLDAGEGSTPDEDGVPGEGDRRVSCCRPFFTWRRASRARCCGRVTEVLVGNVVESLKKRRTDSSSDVHSSRTTNQDPDASGRHETGRPPPHTEAAPSKAVSKSSEGTAGGVSMKITLRLTRTTREFGK